MKKTFLYAFPGFFLVCIMTNMTYSQNSRGTAKLKQQPASENNISLPNNGLDPGSVTLNELKINEINAKAVRNFTRDYRNVHDARWFKSVNGLIVACFISDNIQSWVCYNEKGGYEYMIRHYTEEKLPRQVRHLLKSIYYDFSIFHVNEITINGITVYVVTMEDKTSEGKTFWKIIKVIDGEMETMKEYSEKKNDAD